MLVARTRWWGAVWLLALCCMSYAAGVLPSVRRSGIDNTDPVWLGLVATVVGLSVVWAAVLVLDHAAVWVLGSDVIGAVVGTMVASVGVLAQEPDSYYPGLMFLMYAVFLALPLGVGAVIGAAVRAARIRKVRATSHNDPDV
jgi:hypothetical protein